MTNEHDKDTRTLDRLTREAGLAEMGEGPATADDRRWGRDLVASYQERIAEARRGLLPDAPPIKKAGPIKSSLLALGRAALESLFTERTQSWGAQLQFAHRNLDTLSDDDLRLLIQMIDTRTAE